ncbi:MAG: hypothetical protein KDA85_19290, partial [Planctomycetaceae bacterium]|nr:hypothetical protein [Planctomycetaceae bacterium]
MPRNDGPLYRSAQTAQHRPRLVAAVCLIAGWLLSLPCHLIADEQTAADPAEGSEIPLPQPTPGDAAEASPAVEPPEPPYSGPVELIPLVRIGGMRDDYSRFRNFLDQRTAGEDWKNQIELISMDLFDELESAKDKTAWICDEPFFEWEVVLLVSALKPTDTKNASIISVPITLDSLKKLSESETWTEPDDDGFVEDTANDTLVLSTEHGVILGQLNSEWTQAEPEFRLLMQEAAQRIARKPSSGVMSFAAEPGRIRNGLRNPFLSSVLSALLTNTQQRDEEQSFSYRLRETWGKSAAAGLDLLINQVESAACILDFDDETERTRVSLRINAVKNSKFDRWIDLQQDATATAIRWLNPNAEGFLSVSLVQPEILRTMVPLLSDAFADSLRSSQLISDATVADISRIARSVATAPTFEALLQCLPGENDTWFLAATFPFPEPQEITASTIELVSAIDDPAWQLSAAEIDGWPVHRYPNSIPHIGTTGLTDTWIAATDQQITIFQGSVDSAAPLAQLVRRDYEPLPDVSAWRRNGIAGRLELISCYRMIRGGDG